jgi:hypothetical protein
MGRYCHVCHRNRPHERFGGKGYRSYVCDRCRKLPRIDQQRVLFADEVFGFLAQSNISAKNIARLQVIEGFEVEAVARQAAVVRQIALVKPHKRRRWRFLRENHPELFQQAIDVRLIDPEEDWADSLGASPFEELDDPWDSAEGEKG